MSSSLCYNKGCGKTYAAEEVDKEVCVHHPGEPYFHDAYKGWTCCDKKSIDFTEFLNFKGCKTGKHNPNKPAEPVKPDPCEVVIQTQNKPPEPVQPDEMERPPEDTPMVAFL